MTGEVGMTGRDLAFLRDFGSLSRIGATAAGGVSREAGTAADGRLKAWLTAWLTTHGFDVKVDAIGNVYGTVEWRSGDPYLLTGSHLDSQPTAGRFDGAYGVLASAYAALEIKRRVERGELAPGMNLAVVNWFNEEGSRFKPSMMGSAVYNGTLALEDALARRARGEATTVGAALEEMGFVGVDEAPRAAAYAEIHIEQGRLLEHGNVDIGIVDTTWCARKYQVRVRGSQAHTGSTPIAERRDALYGAALIVTGARDLVHEFPEGSVHSSSGELSVYPNSPVVVASEVLLHVDVRAATTEDLHRADRLLNELFERAATQANVEVEIENAHEWRRADFDPAGVALAAEICDRLGLSSRRIATIAGHDATNLRDLVPAVMLFVPSVDGISHNELEFTRDGDLVNGLSVLTEVLHRTLAGALHT